MAEKHYYKVLHPGGLRIRKEAKSTSEVIGDIIKFESMVVGSRPIQLGTDKFVELESGGWIIAEKGNLKTLEEVNSQKSITGIWYYKGIYIFLRLLKIS